VAVPLLGYTDATRRWPVNAKRIIFWGKEPNVGMFTQARSIPNAYVCIDNKSINHEKLIEEANINDWYREVVSGAVPWIVALKEMMLSEKDSKVQEIIEKLELTSRERGELIFECDDNEEKDRVVNFIESGDSANCREVEGRQVIQKDGQWFSYNNKGGMYRISNATFKIERCTWLPNKKKNKGVISGTVQYKGREERFNAPMREFMAHTVRWLREFMVENQMGFLETSKSWERYMTAISNAFNPEEVIQEAREARVGWSKDLTQFVFPNATMSNGLVDEQDLGLPVDGLPCEKVTGRTIATSVLEKFLEPNDLNRNFWASFMCILSNVSAPYYGQSVRKIGIVGSDLFCELFAKGLGLIEEHQPKVTNTSLKKLSAMIQHDVPPYFTFDNNFNTVAKWMEDAISKNVIVQLTEAQAAMFSGEGWRFIHLEDMASGDHLRFGSDILQHAVRTIQTEGVSIDADDPLPGLASLIASWVVSRTDEDTDCAVIYSALNLISDNGLWGDVDAGAAFLYAVFALVMDGQTSITRKGYDKKLSDVVLDGDTVVMYKRVMKKMPFVKSRKKVSEKLFNLGILTHSTPTEWILKRDKWEEIHSRWLSSYQD